MAEIKNEEAKDKAFVEITIQPGEKIALCRCFKSANMPYCDGAHKEVPGTGPAIVDAKL
tara:strand:+ start:884 stop:1060 length:177 start_codon:yes stop_codon:yes gene_type:complete